LRIFAFLVAALLVPLLTLSGFDPARQTGHKFAQAILGIFANLDGLLYACDRSLCSSKCDRDFYHLTPS